MLFHTPLQSACGSCNRYRNRNDHSVVVMSGQWRLWAWPFIRSGSVFSASQILSHWMFFWSLSGLLLQYVPTQVFEKTCHITGRSQRVAATFSLRKNFIQPTRFSLWPSRSAVPKEKSRTAYYTITHIIIPFKSSHNINYVIISVLACSLTLIIAPGWVCFLNRVVMSKEKERKDNSHHYMIGTESVHLLLMNVTSPNTHKQMRSWKRQRCLVK